MSDTDDEISLQVELIYQARRKLADLMIKACPGPHVYVKHRDHKPAWCAVCGYAWTGERVKEMP